MKVTMKGAEEARQALRRSIDNFPQNALITISLPHQSIVHRFRKDEGKLHHIGSHDPENLVQLIDNGLHPDGSIDKR